MNPKEALLESSIEELDMIHQALLKKKYFGLTTDESKQHLFVCMILQMKKDWYFAGCYGNKNNNGGREES